MANLHHAIDDLKDAKNHYLNVLDNGEYSGYEKSLPWKKFVKSLNSVWVDTELGMRSMKGKFMELQKEFKAARKCDPLLVYLYQSRHVSEHSIFEMVDLEIVDYNKVVDTLQVSRMDENGNVEETFNHPIFPAKLQLKSVTNHGITYDPPNVHLGRTLPDGRDPLHVGWLGLVFYANFLIDVDKKLLSGSFYNSILKSMENNKNLFHIVK